MWIDAFTKLEEANKAGTAPNWDIVTTPSFPDKPGAGAKVDAHILMVSSQSKYKDEAFEIIQMLTASKEVQADVARSGKGCKRTNKMALLPKFHPLDSSAVGKPMNDAVTNVTQKDNDINTALRQAEEVINLNLESMKK